jgi:hypothetical protein
MLLPLPLCAYAFRVVMLRCVPRACVVHPPCSKHDVPLSEGEESFVMFVVSSQQQRDGSSSGKNSASGADSKGTAVIPPLLRVSGLEQEAVGPSTAHSDSNQQVSTESNLSTVHSGSTNLPPPTPHSRTVTDDVMLFE